MIKQLKNRIAWYLYKGLYKPGHFYHPTPSLEEVKRRKKEIFHKELPAGIELNIDAQESLLREWEALVPDFNWLPEPGAVPGNRYYSNNGYFNETDAFSLYAMMRHFRPAKIVEVGSGFSSALMMDVNDKFFGGNIEMQFVEPFPERLNGLLRPADRNTGKYTIRQEFVQQVDYKVFESLRANDMLFIDSSHVSKVGSDVNFLLFNILPRLAQGVIIHIHDVFYPFEYPESWVNQGIYWNEAYLLRSFLQYNHTFEIVFFTNYWEGKRLEAHPFIKSGASIWLRKKG